ncbi:MAG: class I SAM-dependent methyltransferase [Candidatus Izimaplasma sp.]|nr:class I SAM-dependent methyltransferase [Candidatus Izimaplasma bacterium]
MNVKKLNSDLQNYWNNMFKKLKPEKINLSEVKVKNELDEAFEFMGNNARSILDIGAGSGYALFTAKILGTKLSYGLGIDTSENAIRFAKKTCELSKIKGLNFEVGNESYLSKLENEAFDGIICSNVLDVIPEETSKQIIADIARLLKPNGFLLLKFNFYLTKDLIERIKMERIEKNVFTLNGILRGVNYTTEEWIRKFKKFKVVKQSEYDRIKSGPKDRVILLQKQG